jgi:hypothetical protein
VSIHTIIENLAAYEAVRADDPKGDRRWWSTSTAVIDELTRRGEACRSMEANISFCESDLLAEAGYSFADSLQEVLNECCSWREYADIGLAVAALVNQCFFVTIYKSLLLERVVVEAEKSGGQIECVGDPLEVTQVGLSMTYGRFDTIFALLAKSAPLGHLVVVPHALNGEELNRRHRAVIDRKMGPREKLLSLVSNTPGSFVFKAWKRLQSNGWLLFKQARLFPFVKRRFFINGGNELIDEIFLELLRKGGSVSMLPPLPKAERNLEVTDAIPDEAAIMAAFRLRAIDAIGATGIQIGPVITAGVGVVCDRFLKLLRRIHSSFGKLTVGYQKICDQIGKDAFILSHGMSTVEEKFFYNYCQVQGMTVVAFEHGVTLGLSRWTDIGRRHFAMQHADIGVYNSRVAVDEMAAVVPNQRRISAGLPRTTMGLGFRNLRRKLARNWLEIDPDTHVVMCVAELEKNNYVYGPSVDNDLQYYNKTVALVNALCEAFPGSKIVLKLYPTERYLDSQNFFGLSEKYENLMIVKDVDFRFIGLGADLIVTSSTQSTLGWVLGSGIPCLFAEFDWAPSNLSGLKMNCASVDGLNTLMVLDTSKFIHRRDLGFVSILFEKPAKRPMKD